jgi:RNA polymerase sigma-70 factor (ECF subfamily)
MEDLTTTLGAAQIAVPPDEDELLAARARTDSAAFGLLYERHALAVYRYLRARGAAEDQAKELAAVAFERALRSIGRFRPGRAGFRSWLFAIARNAWVDAHRRRARDADLGEAATMAAPGPSPEAAVVAAEERELVMRLLAQLPEAARDALALRYAAGLSGREIAHVIGKSEDATKKLLSRSLASLREAARHDR